MSVEEPAGQRSLLTPAPAKPPLLRLLDFAPVVLLAVVLIVFGCLSGKFLTADNLTQVLVQSSATAIVATGMTFVLLTAGVDLSVGTIMFVAPAQPGSWRWPDSLCRFVWRSWWPSASQAAP